MRGLLLLAMTEKEALFQHCLGYVQQRIGRIQAEIEQAQNSANEETKSTAGDKYETGRAMAQLEIERNLIQLKEAEKLNSILHALPHSTASNQVKSGSLVTTSKGTFFIAISLGQVAIQDKQYFVVSTDSPIGKLLLGRKKGDSFHWNGSEHTIQAIS
jgi:transcription elongation GreA/GreB family factor